MAPGPDPPSAGERDAAPAQRARPVEAPLRLVLVDDHEVVRSGLRAVVEKAGIQVVGEAEDVPSAVEVAQRTHPDVLVLDVRIPGGGGHRVLEELDPVPPTLAVSASDERDDVVRTVAAGATGYLLKTASSDAIVRAIRSTAAGEPVFSPELAGHVLDLDLDLAAVDDPAWEALTDRQVEVLRLLARGRTYKQIAEELVVSVKTVETHVRHVLQALQVENRHEAARWAMERGLE